MDKDSDCTRKSTCKTRKCVCKKDRGLCGPACKCKCSLEICINQQHTSSLSSDQQIIEQLQNQLAIYKGIIPDVFKIKVEALEVKVEALEKKCQDQQAEINNLVQKLHDAADTTNVTRMDMDSGCTRKSTCKTRKCVCKKDRDLCGLACKCKCSLEICINQQRTSSLSSDQQIIEQLQNQLAIYKGIIPDALKIKVEALEKKCQDQQAEINNLVQKLHDAADTTNVTVLVLEIYNETIRDLLDKTCGPTKQHSIKHDVNGDIYVTNLAKVDACSIGDASNLLKEATQKGLDDMASVWTAQWRFAQHIYGSVSAAHLSSQLNCCWLCHANVGCIEN